MKLEQLLATEMLADLRTDPGRLPVVSVECIAPESGAFSWGDHFRRLLLQMEEPLLDHKLEPGISIHIGSRAFDSCRTRKRGSGIPLCGGEGALFQASGCCHTTFESS
jgi:hypothetical protein